MVASTALNLLPAPRVATKFMKTTANRAPRWTNVEISEPLSRIGKLTCLMRAHLF